MRLRRLRQAVAKKRAGSKSVWVKSRQSKRDELLAKIRGLRPDVQPKPAGKGEFRYGLTPLSDDFEVLY